MALAPPENLRFGVYRAGLSGGYGIARSSNTATGTFNAQITLAWDANPAGDNVTNYNIYSGIASGQLSFLVDTGNVTQYSVDVPYGSYLALTAENATGESAFSEETQYV